MRRLFLSYIFIFNSSLLLFSQTDSLTIWKDWLSKETKTNAKIKLFHKIANYYEQNNQDSAYKYYNQIISCEAKINAKNTSCTYALYDSYSFLSNFYLQKHNFKLSALFTNKALSITIPKYDYSRKFNLYFNLVEIYLYSEIYDSAAFFTYFLIKIPDSTLNFEQRFLKNYSIASVYISLNLSRLATFYIDKTTQLANTLKDSTYSCLSYYIIAKSLHNEKKYFYAEIYYKEAIKKCPSHKTFLRDHILFALSQLYVETNKPYLAKYHLMELISKSQNYSDFDTLLYIKIYLLTAQILSTKQPQTAFGYFKNALTLVDKYVYEKLPISVKINIIDFLISNETSSGNYQNAYNYSLTKFKLIETLNTIKQNAIAFNFLYRFDLENKTILLDSLQKTQEITQKLIQKQRERNRYQTVAIILLILIAFIFFSFVLWISFSYRKIKQLNQKITQTNINIKLTQNRLEKIVELLPEIFVEIDINGRIIAANRNFFNYCIFNKNEIQNIYFSQLFAPQEDFNIKEILQQIKEKNKPISFEAILTGKEKNHNVLVSIIFDKTQRQGEFYAIMVDITEKQKNEQELKLFKKVIEQTKNIIVITNQHAQIQFVNRSFENITGYTFEEVKNQNPRFLQSGLTPLETFDEMWKTILAGNQWKGTLINKTKYGQIFYEKTNITPIINDKNEITHFIAIKEDITEEIQKSEILSKLFSSVENSPVSVMLLDLERRITYVNPAFENITGYKHSEVIGKTSSFLNYASYTKEFYQNIWKQVETEFFWIGKYINVKKDKSLYWVQSTVVAVKNEKEQIIGYVVNEQDITQQIITQQQLENTLNELNEKNLEIESSLMYAKRIQNSLLPNPDIISSDIQSFVIYLPKDIVSGDFYWFHKKDNLIYIAVGDCTGHGVPGAFLSLLGITILEDAIVVNDLTTPSSILKYLGLRIHNFFEKNKTKDNIIDDIEVSIVLVDKARKKITYCGSRTKLYIVRFEINQHFEHPNIEITNITYDRKMYQIKASRSFLISDAYINTYTDTDLEYLSTDMFYCASDGYYDQFGGPHNKKMTRANFENYLFEISHHELEEQKELLLFNLINWKGSNPQNDDITILGFKIQN